MPKERVPSTRVRGGRRIVHPAGGTAVCIFSAALRVSSSVEAFLPCSPPPVRAGPLQGGIRFLSSGNWKGGFQTLGQREDECSLDYRSRGKGLARRICSTQVGPLFMSSGDKGVSWFNMSLGDVERSEASALWYCRDFCRHQ